MTESEVVQAVVAWVVAECPALQGTYDYLPAGKAQALPDVAVEIMATEILRDDPDFYALDIQQVILKVRRLAINFMADAGTTEANQRAAQLLLRTFVDALVASALADHTLGGRVQIASPFLAVDYDPAFVEYDDGTRGRQCIVQLAVAEALVGANDA